MLSVDVVTQAVVRLAAVTEPEGLLPAREQMALSLGWHIVLACFGVAFPAMIFVMHLRGIRRDDPVALELAKRVMPGGEVVGSDFSDEMLARARTKAAGRPELRFEHGDALALPYADGEFQAATVGFGNPVSSS